ncbi:MAG: HAD family phosphatase [Prochloron sp. SP5CPC1]|nr:HAD family phosphatase [Candidatus Paraprochloron terpiosi SP5CPC1]
MTLKAILFDFNGVIINDESIHRQLVTEILERENISTDKGEYRETCLGKSDRLCLRDILALHGRFVQENYLNQLIEAKNRAYRERLAALETLPIYPGVEAFLEKIREQGLSMGVVTGALRSEVELVLDRAQITPYFNTIVAGDEVQESKPEPQGYLLAVERLYGQNTYLQIRPGDCLAIEDSYPGIEAAKRAGMQVVGVANTYPFHMIQRRADWSVDYLSDLELDRVEQVFARI